VTELFLQIKLPKVDGLKLSKYNRTENDPQQFN